MDPPNLLFNFYQNSRTEVKRPELDYDHYILFSVEEKSHAALQHNFSRRDNFIISFCCYICLFSPLHNFAYSEPETELCHFWDLSPICAVTPAPYQLALPLFSPHTIIPPQDTAGCCIVTILSDLWVLRNDHLSQYAVSWGFQCEHSRLRDKPTGSLPSFPFCQTLLWRETTNVLIHTIVWSEKHTAELLKQTVRPAGCVVRDANECVWCVVTKNTYFPGEHYCSFRVRNAGYKWNLLHQRDESPFEVIQSAVGLVIEMHPFFATSLCNIFLLAEPGLLVKCCEQLLQ